MRAAEPILHVKDLSKRFGGLVALNGVNFSVGQGEIVGLIGPNGAGKTTCFNTICGTFPASGGEVLLRGRQISGLRTSQIAKMGMVRTFQLTTLFKEETVWENVLRGTLIQRDRKERSLWDLFRNTEPPAAVRAKVEDVIASLGLAQVRDALAGALPYGLQKRLGVAIAMVAEPDLILMDEPAAGLNPEESVAMSQLIRRLRDERGLSVLIVEHDMKMIMGICDRIIVLEHGEQIAAGSPLEIRNNPEVIKAYLGGELVH